MEQLVRDLDKSSFEEFASTIRGQLTFPEDSNYAEACKLYNGMIHKKPGLIVKCVDVADV